MILQSVEGLVISFMLLSIEQDIVGGRDLDLD